MKIYVVLKDDSIDEDMRYSDVKLFLNKENAIHESKNGWYSVYEAELKDGISLVPGGAPNLENVTRKEIIDEMDLWGACLDEYDPNLTNEELINEFFDDFELDKDWINHDLKRVY